MTTVTINSLKTRQVRQNVYNFQVENVHTYAVGHVGILVHNKPDLDDLPEDWTLIDNGDDTVLEDPPSHDFWTPDSGEPPLGNQFPHFPHDFRGT
jgi:hypothetical protein